MVEIDLSIIAFVLNANKPDRHKDGFFSTKENFYRFTTPRSVTTADNRIIPIDKTKTFCVHIKAESVLLFISD